MANTRGLRRSYGKISQLIDGEWTRAWGSCEWPKGCNLDADYKNQLGSFPGIFGRVVQTCARHTPLDMRKHPRQVR